MIEGTSYCAEKLSEEHEAADDEASSAFSSFAVNRDQWAISRCQKVCLNFFDLFLGHVCALVVGFEAEDDVISLLFHLLNEQKHVKAYLEERSH